MKHWYRVSSDDLVHWKNEGLALKPELLYENSGCYSGSGLPEKDTLYLAYTGNAKDYAKNRYQYQLLAKMDRYGRITKCEKPLIYPNPDYTEHQRDPKLFAYKDRYYILMGAQNPEKKGVMLLYSANSPEGTWQFDGELKVRGYETFGFMCECPCIERIGDKWILLFSPQGIEAEGDLYQQKYNNVYFIGDFDPEKLEFIPDGPYQELDRGFDFYAAQCASQEVYRDAAVLIGWASCPDYTTPLTDEIGYSHIQTLPRLLTIEDGKLMQRPAPDMKKLEGEVLFKAENGTITADKLHGLMPRTAIIHLENPSLQSTELSLYSKNGRRGFEISYDRNAKVLTVDRSALNHQINEECGAVRRIALENGLSALDVYVDRSSVEIFVNNGEKVVSARVFPEADERILRMGGKDINLSIYSPLKSVEDNFII
jgi:beta-fructofuranosidase